MLGRYPEGKVLNWNLLLNHNGVGYDISIGLHRFGRHVRFLGSGILLVLNGSSLGLLLPSLNFEFFFELLKLLDLLLWTSLRLRLLKWLTGDVRVLSL